MVVLALVAAVAATLGGASPTGVGLVDAVYVGGAGALLALAGGRARRLSWLVSAVAALWLAPTGFGRVVAVLAIALAAYAAATRRRRAIGAAVGALIALVLGDLGGGGFHGSTTLWAGLAALPVLVSALIVLPPAPRRLLSVSASIVGAVSVVATLLFGASVLLAVGDVESAVDAAERGFGLAGEGDEINAARELDVAEGRFRSARNKVGGFWTYPARLVPVVGQHARAAQVVASEGVSLSATASDTARAVDTDGIRMVQGRIDVGEIEQLAPILDRTERALDRAYRRITAANSPWLFDGVDSRIDELLEELDHARPAARTAALAAREIPTMLGATRPVNWLVMLTTPAEARGLGGLVGNWVLIGADDGAVVLADSGRNSDLNEVLRADGAELRGPAQYLDRWASFHPEEFFQDVTLSPDLPMVAEVAADLFEQATSRTVDGVIVLDPYAIAAILDLAGPVQTSAIRLTADSVVPYLLEEQYALETESERVQVLQELMEGAFAAFTTAELPAPAGVADTLGPMVEQGRLGAWWAGGDGPTELLDDTGLDGRFPDPGGGDLLGVVHQNAGQNKLDTYIERFVDYELVIDDGDATGTITVIVSNEVPGLDLPLTVIGNNDQGYPLGTNVARVTVHTALDLRAARLDGEPVDAVRERAFGLDAVTVVVEIPPGEFRTLEIDVAGRLELGRDDYRITLPAQPLVNPDRVRVHTVIDGEETTWTDDLRLVRDTVLGRNLRGR